jgi:glutaminyl-peptide cyclotransferase
MKGRNRIISGVLAIALIIALFMGGCNGGCNHPVPPPTTDTTHPKPVSIAIPAFRADSAYAYVKKQVDFGPRTPGSKSHEECLQFILNELKADSLRVTVQKSSAKTFDGKTFEFENIIASTQPSNPTRIFLSTHWDTRPFADADSVNPMGNFDGADDGGSGVAVLLEVARHLHSAKIPIGVDLVFFDLEDYGQEANDGKFPRMPDSWCLGSQYWSKNLPTGYSPEFGILLDMVGAKNAVFPREGTSMQYAPDVVNKIWALAGKLGYSSYFTQDETGPTTDDHTYVNEITKIPTIDIVHYDIARENYPYFHHCHSDKLDIIDTATLHMVGRLVMTVIYTENNGNMQP